MQAEAAASHNRVALDRMLIEQLPQIVREAAAGLAGANVSVLNGAEGLSEIAAGLVAQGLTILESVKKGMAGATDAAVPDAEEEPAEKAPEQASAGLPAAPGTAAAAAAAARRAAVLTRSNSARHSRPVPIQGLANSVVLRGCRITA